MRGSRQSPDPSADPSAEQSTGPSAGHGGSIAPQTQTRSPSEWLDRLLSASNQIAPDAGLADAVRAVLESVAPSLADVAIGVCMADGRGGTLAVRVGAEGEIDHPARMFPSFGAEVVHTVPLDGSTTLHLATLDIAGPDVPPVMVDRLVATLGATLRRARAFESAPRGASDDQEVESRMIHAERLAGLGQIAAGIVHDLNTPLTTVVAYADYLRKKWANAPHIDESDRQRLIRIHEAAERLLVFSRDLMAYSRPSPHVATPVDIHDVLERALAFCEHAVSSARVAIERDYGQVQPVRGVADQLVQVFVNLVTNACQAARADGTARVAITTARSHDGRGVRITVADDGVGLPPEAERLFEPFFTTKDGGTGLGLAIVRKIVAGHGGHVHAERGASRGTAFVVELPRAAGSPDQPDEPRARRTPSPTNPEPDEPRARRTPSPTNPEPDEP